MGGSGDEMINDQDYDAAAEPRWAAAITELAQWWHDERERPRISEEVLVAWDRLVAAWSEDATMPLLVRKRGSRGAALQHATGRVVVAVDNAPANWCFSTALLGRCPTLAEIQLSLEEARLP